MQKRLWRGARALLNREKLPGALSVSAAFLLMLAHPLIYRNFYFDINRFKFAAFAYSAIGLGVAYLLLCALRRGALAGRVYAPFRLTLADAGMICLMIVSLVSCVLADDPFSAFTGDEGRLSGLVFLFAVGSAYLVVSRAQASARAATAGLLISGALCALLGLLNFFRIDPLGFYERLGENSAQAFISTIGNIDFFGAFLCLFLPAAAAMAVRGARARRLLCLPLVALGAAAAVAARTEGALIAPLGAALAALLLGAPSRRLRARMCAALAALFLGFCAVGALCAAFPEGFMPLENSAAQLIANRPLVMGAIALPLSASAYALRKAPAREYPARGRAWRRAVWIAGFAAFFACLLALLYFTFIRPEAELEGGWRLLRFQDKWGSNRGGVWTRCLKLYGDANLRVKLVGLGADCLKAPLAEAYGSEITAYCNLSFDNAHNELIQYLLTLGALGLASYAAFASGCVKTLLRRQKTNVYAACQLAAACVYLLNSLVNVNQPITTPLFFIFLSAGVNAPEAPEISE